MTKAQFVKQFEKIKRRLEKDRDDLRALVDEATDILEKSDRAADAMQYAAASLSDLL